MDKNLSGNTPFFYVKIAFNLLFSRESWMKIEAGT